MKKLTQKQQKELEVVKWFIPEELSKIEIKEEDITKFFENSQQGKHKEKVKNSMYLTNDKMNGLGALMYGKNKREININMYKQDFTQYKEILKENLNGKWIENKDIEDKLKDVWLGDLGFPDFIRENIKSKL